MSFSSLSLKKKCVSLKFRNWKLCKLGSIFPANGLSLGHPHQRVSRCQWPFHICSNYYCPFAYGHIASRELLWHGLWRTCKVWGGGLPKTEARYKLSILVASVCLYVTTILIDVDVDVVNSSCLFLFFLPEQFVVTENNCALYSADAWVDHAHCHNWGFYDCPYPSRQMPGQPLNDTWSLTFASVQIIICLHPVTQCCLFSAPERAVRYTTDTE
jgi:hypothetical protein